MLEGIRYIKLPGKNYRALPNAAKMHLSPDVSVPKRHFVKVNEEHFVHEIKKRPILYNCLHPDYKRNSLRNDAWVEVAIRMGLSEQECKKRWRSMRDAFLKNFRTKSEKERKSWIHYRLLEFLLPHIRKGEDESTNDCSQYIGRGDEIDYVGVDSDGELYDGPVTVSYVTQDGKELFQVMHSSIKEDLSIDDDPIIEEEEVLDEIPQTVEHPHRRSCSAAPSNDYLLTTTTDDESEQCVEERLDTTTLQSGRASPGGPEQMGEIQRAWTKEDLELDVPVMKLDAVEELRAVCKRRKMDQIDRHLSTEDNVQSPPIVNASREPSPPLAPPAQREECKESDARLGITDPDERFLLSCAPILRRLPNKKNLLARLRIQQLLYELEYDEKYSYEGGT